MNKKGFIDTDVLYSMGFIILVVMAVSATVIGYIVSKGFEYSLPLWQLVLIIFAEVVAAYVIAGRG